MQAMTSVRWVCYDIIDAYRYRQCHIVLDHPRRLTNICYCPIQLSLVEINRHEDMYQDTMAKVSIYSRYLQKDMSYCCIVYIIIFVWLLMTITLYLHIGHILPCLKKIKSYHDLCTKICMIWWRTHIISPILSKLNEFLTLVDHCTEDEVHSHSMWKWVVKSIDIVMTL